MADLLGESIWEGALTGDDGIPKLEVMSLYLKNTGLRSFRPSLRKNLSA